MLFALPLRPLTQMGEKTFGSVDHMSGEQLDVQEKLLVATHSNAMTRLQEERRNRSACWCAPLRCSAVSEHF